MIRSNGGEAVLSALGATSAENVAKPLYNCSKGISVPQVCGTWQYATLL